jgi:cytochrome b pre-mRNA-processing protein 3
MAVGIARVYGGGEAKEPGMLFSRARRNEREAAERVYGAALAAARRPHFYLRCGVPDTLQGRFEMVALNLFPVLHRLTLDPGDDPELARRVAESFVDDMDDALRGVGVSDTRVPKRMKTLYASFAGRVVAYGQALGESEEAVGAAIARNVFPDGGEARHVVALARYLCDAVRAVGAADLSALRRGELSLPDVEIGEAQA